MNRSALALVLIATFALGAALGGCCGSLEEDLQKELDELAPGTGGDQLAPPLEGTAPAGKELSKYEITLFVDHEGAFNPNETALLDDLAKMGFRVDRNPGGGGTNNDANIKVGAGDEAIARLVQTTIGKHYKHDFTIKPIFDKGDSDIFINLGKGKGVTAGKGALGKYEITLFVDHDGDFNAKETALLNELQALGFRIDRSPGGGGTNDDANIKVGAGDEATAQIVKAIVGKHYDHDFTIKPIFDKGDSDIFINVGKSKGGGGGALSKYKIVLFTKSDRTKFTSRESKLLDDLEAVGFQVQRRPGGGGTNDDANIKVGSDNAVTANIVQAIVGKHYKHKFTIKPIFDKGDTDVYVNLGNKGVK